MWSPWMYSTAPTCWYLHKRRAGFGLRDHQHHTACVYEVLVLAINVQHGAHMAVPACSRQHMAFNKLRRHVHASVLGDRVDNSRGSCTANTCVGRLIMSKRTGSVFDCQTHASRAAPSCASGQAGHAESLFVSMTTVVPMMSVLALQLLQLQHESLNFDRWEQRPQVPAVGYMHDDYSLAHLNPTGRMDGKWSRPLTMRM